jgi:hypothetical protein
MRVIVWGLQAGGDHSIARCVGQSVCNVSEGAWRMIPARYVVKGLVSSPARKNASPSDGKFG